MYLLRLVVVAIGIFGLCGCSDQVPMKVPISKTETSPEGGRKAFFTDSVGTQWYVDVYKRFDETTLDAHIDLNHGFEFSDRYDVSALAYGTPVVVLEVLRVLPRPDYTRVVFREFPRDAYIVNESSIVGVKQPEVGKKYGFNLSIDGRKAKLGQEVGMLGIQCTSAAAPAAPPTESSPTDGEVLVSYLVQTAERQSLEQEVQRLRDAKLTSDEARAFLRLCALTERVDKIAPRVAGLVVKLGKKWQSEFEENPQNAILVGPDFPERLANVFKCVTIGDGGALTPAVAPTATEPVALDFQADRDAEDLIAYLVLQKLLPSLEEDLKRAREQQNGREEAIVFNRYAKLIAKQEELSLTVGETVAKYGKKWQEALADGPKEVLVSADFPDYLVQVFSCVKMEDDNIVVVSK